MNGYLKQYYRESHPRIIQPVEPVDDVGHSHDGGHLYEFPLLPQPPPDVTDKQLMQMISLLFVNLIMASLNQNARSMLSYRI